MCGQKEVTGKVSRTGSYYAAIRADLEFVILSRIMAVHHHIQLRKKPGIVSAGLLAFWGEGVQFRFDLCLVKGSLATEPLRQGKVSRYLVAMNG